MAAGGVKRATVPKWATPVGRNGSLQGRVLSLEEEKELREEKGKSVDSLKGVDGFRSDGTVRCPEKRKENYR